MGKSQNEVLVSEAAEIMGVTRQAIHGMIRRGAIRFHRVGHIYLLNLSDIDAALEEERETITRRLERISKVGR